MGCFSHFSPKGMNLTHASHPFATLHAMQLAKWPVLRMLLSFENLTK